MSEMDDALLGLRCPTCDYDLTGLREHRCPECGCEFAPQVLRLPPPSRALAFLALALLAYACTGLFLQIILRVLGTSIWNSLSSAYSIKFKDAVGLGFLMSGLGGIVAGTAAIIVAIIGSKRRSEKLYWTGLLAAVIMLVTGVLAYIMTPHMK